MSQTYPIVAVTGSSGAGTTVVRRTFEEIFSARGITAAIIEGDSFHKYDREEMGKLVGEWERTAGRGISHFGPEANLFYEMDALFRSYGNSGSGVSRLYLHNEERASLYGKKPGTFTSWKEISSNTDLLFYEGLHGGVKYNEINIAKHVDLLIGVTPTINLEWIQKIHRDRSTRGYSTEAVTDTILRRMHAYIHCIIPQFTETDINFQRVPVVDTSNPLVARWIPTADESIVVIRFKNPHGIDFPYLVSMISGSWMSRANSIVIPGGKLDLAMQLILTPLIARLISLSKRS